MRWRPRRICAGIADALDAFARPAARRSDDHPVAGDSTAASTAQIGPRQTSQLKNLLRCFQIFAFVAARHARLKVPLDRNPMKSKSDRRPDFAPVHHLSRNPACTFRDRAAALFDLFFVAARHAT
jgi:hypothetical protein